MYDSCNFDRYRYGDKVMAKSYKDKYNAPFPTRFRELMGEMKQQDLANELGVKRQTISNYYHGKAHPDFCTLVKIAEYFNVSTDYLTGKSKVKTDDITLQQVCEYTRLSENICAILNSINEDDKLIKVISDMIRSLKELDEDYKYNNEEKKI
jgi:transcriptional regulator with XRE-family HTH domain